MIKGWLAWVTTFPVFSLQRKPDKSATRPFRENHLTMGLHSFLIYGFRDERMLASNTQKSYRIL